MCAYFLTNVLNTSAVGSINLGADAHLCTLRDTPIARFPLFEDVFIPWVLLTAVSVYVILHADARVSNSYEEVQKLKVIYPPRISFSKTTAQPATRVELFC